MELTLKQFLVIGYNRKLDRSTHYVVNPFVPRLIGHPIFFIISTLSTGRELYEEAWMQLRFML